MKSPELKDQLSNELIYLLTKDFRMINWNENWRNYEMNIWMNQWVNLRQDEKNYEPLTLTMNHEP